jgi:glycosyltransferase involved in cell wall biosynthesis
MKQSLEKLIAQFNLQDRVVMPGPVRGEQKIVWLRNAGIFVLPSEGEGLSLSRLEAAACVLPMLLATASVTPRRAIRDA